MKEIWKEIKGYEDLYQVSNLGRVKSLDRVTKTSRGSRVYNGKILKASYDGFGYCAYGLCKDGKSINKRAHQLVAIAFLNHTPNGLKLVVDHIDANPKNNNVDNLQLVTHRFNISKGSKGKSSSIYTGVTWHKIKEKWMASITYEKKTYHLGYYNCELTASMQYDNKLRELTNA